MDRWKSRGGKSQRREEKKKEDQRRERVRRNKVQVRERVEKSRITVFFQWFVAPDPEGRKVGSLKRRVRSHLARWEMKNCTSLRREAHFEVKMYKTHQVGPLLEVEMSKKCTPLWREAHFEVKSAKNWGVRSTFGRSDVVGRRGTFEENPQRCISRGRHGTRDMVIRDVRRSGRWFPERGCILEHQIFRFAKMILRDRRRQLGIQLSSIEGSLAELLRFWRCQFQKIRIFRKSRRIAALLMLSSSKIE